MQTAIIKDIGIVSISGNIHAASQSGLIDMSLTYAYEGCSSIIYLMNSWGGSIDAGISIYNFLKSLTIPTIVYNIGTIESIAIPIFMACKTRYACPSSKFMHHEYNWSLGDNKTITIAQATQYKQTLELEHRRVEMIVRAEGYDEQFISDLFPKENTYYSPEKALEYGLVHEIRPLEIPINRIYGWRTIAG